MIDAAPPRQYRTPYHIRKHCKERRDRNRLTERCINDTKEPSHGPPTHGVRCDACHATHKATRRTRAEASARRMMAKTNTGG